MAQESVSSSSVPPKPTHRTTPQPPPTRTGIKLPHLTLLVKNQQRYFSFEVAVLDDMDVRRRFRASNYQAVTRVKPYIATMPLRLDDGWNQVALNLQVGARGGCSAPACARMRLHALACVCHASACLLQLWR
jgi:hypothetical protein